MLSTNRNNQNTFPESTINVSTGKMELKEIIGGGVRLASLDFFRGMVMVLLMIEASGLYRHWRRMTDTNSLMHSMAVQFSHHPWHGLHFWDLIQPAFMFMAGTAMAFSLTKQTLNGSSWGQQAKHALKELVAIFWGVLDYAVREIVYHSNFGMY